MFKETRLAFAATCLAGSCGLAMAQGAGADKTEGSDTGRGRPALMQSPMATSAPTSNKMQRKKASLSAKHKIGSAKTSARPGQIRQHIR